MGLITHHKTKTVEYTAWNSMKDRCYYKKSISYKNYGGRGIAVCDRWLNSFENFLKDMGEKPSPKALYSLDRINNDGNYEPNNCRWATRIEQQRNKRDGPPKKGKILQCFICNDEFYRKPYQLEMAKYCSLKCFHLDLSRPKRARNGIHANCAECGNITRYLKPREIRDKNFCSKECFFNSIRAEDKGEL